MYSVTIRPVGPVDYDDGEYLGADIDDVFDDGTIQVLAHLDDIDTHYVTVTDCWVDDAWGIRAVMNNKSIDKILKCRWLEHEVLNAEDVCWAIEEDAQ